MKRIAYYITGHGFGHATRSIAVARALVETGRASVEIQSAVTPFVFRELENVSFRPIKLDVGFLQRDGLSIDHVGTARALQQVLDDFDVVVEREARYLAAQKFDAIAADIPAAPFLAAQRAGIPSFGIANFDWAWIYDAYRHVDPVYTRAVERFAPAYRAATKLLRLPFAPAMELFPVRTDIPLVVRAATQSREEVRRALGLSSDPRPLVLISFGGLGLGGFGLEGFDESSVAAMKDVIFVAFGSRGPDTPAHVLRIRDDAFHFPNLVQAADAVITKLGYGIVSECVAHRTAMIYTPRPDFPEYAVMTATLGDHVPCAEVSVEDLRKGAFADRLRAIIPKVSSAPKCRIDGASAAAAALL